MGSLGDIEKRLKWARSGPEQRERPGRVGNPMGSPRDAIAVVENIRISEGGAPGGHASRFPVPPGYFVSAQSQPPPQLQTRRQLEVSPQSQRSAIASAHSQEAL